MSALHKLRITSPDGRGVLTTVEMDGEPLRGVTLIELSAGVDGMVTATIRLYADVEFEGEAAVVTTWRNALPLWRRVGRAIAR